jgi:hypothetical protein
VDPHRHLAELHPSKYGALLDGAETVGILDVRDLTAENVALRLVVLADRMYDRDLRLVAGECHWTGCSPAMLKGVAEEISPRPVPLDRPRQRGLKTDQLIHRSRNSRSADPVGLP